MAEPKEVTEETLAQIKEYIESVKYGSINIIIQDGNSPVEGSLLFRLSL